MKYTIFKIKNMITLEKIVIISILAVLISFPIKVSSNILFQNNFNAIDKYIWGINNFEFFYIPVVCLYFYFMSFIKKDTFERMYLYRFKSKKQLLKVNLIVSLIFTIFFVVLLNTSLFLSLLLGDKGSIALNDLILFIISNILQVLVLYIYELICTAIDYLVVKNNKVIMAVSRISIILITALGSFIPVLYVFKKISLYNYFTYLNVIESRQSILFILGILVFISLFLFNVLETIVTNTEYMKYLDKNIEI